MKDINLFEGIKKSAPQKKASRAVSAGLVILILSALALGGIYGWLRYTGYGLDNKIASLNQDVSNLQTASGGDFNIKQNRLTALQSYNKTLETLNQNVRYYPRLNIALLNDIAGRMPSDVYAQSISYQGGILMLVCIADNVDSPASFAAALKNSLYFDSVEYKGSIYLDEQSQPDIANKYQFTVDCYVKGGAAQ